MHVGIRGRATYRFFRTYPVIPIVILVAVVVSAIFAPLIAPHSPTLAVLRDSNRPPFWFEGGSMRYILGADHQGRDVLSRVIYGARISMTIAAVAVTAGMLVGTSLGLLAGYFGGVLDDLVMRLVDVSLAIPFILLALTFVVVFGQSFTLLLGLLALVSWSGYARQIRAEVLQLREMDYVALAKVAGAPRVQILYRHIFPGVVNTIIVLGTLQVGHLILVEAILSFLGAGISPPTPAWGSMIAEGRIYLASAWWIAVFPGIGIFFTVLAINFFGDWLRDRLDPRLRQL
ncbi:MAG: ABC transporter permease [Chloroflexota bacterium]|nr:ABC transporter permease [Chloroflexota bacterium]